MNEQALIEKLRLIEALFAGAATMGEKVAAEEARKRIQERLRLVKEEDPPVEYRFSMADMWSRKVFLALLRRYGIKPYRYRRQRYTTVMARVSKRFVDETLWPEFLEFSETLNAYLSDITDRVVSQVIHPDSSEAEVVNEKRMIPRDAGKTTPATGAPDETKGGLRTKGKAAADSGKTAGRKKGKKKNRKKKNRKR